MVDYYTLPKQVKHVTCNPDYFELKPIQFGMFFTIKESELDISSPYHYCYQQHFMNNEKYLPNDARILYYSPYHQNIEHSKVKMLENKDRKEFIDLVCKTYKIKNKENDSGRFSTLDRYKKSYPELHNAIHKYLFEDLKIELFVERKDNCEILYTPFIDKYFYLSNVETFQNNTFKQVIKYYIAINLKGKKAKYASELFNIELIHLRVLEETESMRTLFESMLENYIYKQSMQNFIYKEKYMCHRNVKYIDNNIFEFV